MGVLLVLNIWLLLLARAKKLTSLKGALHALILPLFIYGQIGLSAHPHDHEHEDEPSHSVCEYCILAIQDDSVASGEIEGFDGPDLLGVFNPHTIRHAESQSTAYKAVFSRQKPQRHDLNIDAIRAPPLN